MIIIFGGKAKLLSEDNRTLNSYILSKADGKHGLEEYLQTHVVYLQYNQQVK